MSLYLANFLSFAFFFLFVFVFFVKSEISPKLQKKKKKKKVFMWVFSHRMHILASYCAVAVQDPVIFLHIIIQCDDSVINDMQYGLNEWRKLVKPSVGLVCRSQVDSRPVCWRNGCRTLWRALHRCRLTDQQVQRLLGLTELQDPTRPFFCSGWGVGQTGHVDVKTSALFIIHF